MPPVAPPSLAGLRVLVVDDEYLVAYHLQTLLEDAGCSVVGPVPSLETALAAVRGEKLDGVLLDANLNGISSAPIATELAARAVPFVVITGYGNLKLGTDALNAAPRMSKPFDDLAFRKTLAAAFLR
jgi:CheY-like chemotaxis protein